MKNDFLNGLLPLSLLALFSGCQTNSSLDGEIEESYQLAGNKFDGGKRVRQTIHFDGIAGTLSSDAKPDLEKTQIDFSRYQIIDEFDPSFESGRKTSTNYHLVDDYSTARVKVGEGAIETSSTSELRGYTFRGELIEKRWHYESMSQSASAPQRAALDAVIYHQRSAYPTSPMKIGTKWSHSPSFVNAFLRQEVRNVEGYVNLTLKKVEVIDGELSAVIGIELLSSGDEVHEDGSVSLATIRLEGEAVVSLETYLETELRLSGEMTGSVLQYGMQNVYTSPIELTSRETYVED